MKTITLVLVLCGISFASLAQKEEVPFYRPLQGDKAISFNFVGLTALALNSSADPLNNAQVVDLRYFFKDNLAFRLGLGLNNLTTTIEIVGDSTGGAPLVVSETKDKKTGFSIGLGAEKHVKTKSKRVDPFLGAGIYFSRLGKNTVTASSKTTQSNGDYVKTDTETINPGGMVIGLAGNLGFFWFFAPNVALGGSFSLGFVTGSIGGDTEMTGTSSSSTGGTVTSTSTSSKTTNKTKISAFQTLNTGAINLLVKF